MTDDRSRRNPGSEEAAIPIMAAEGRKSGRPGEGDGAKRLLGKPKKPDAEQKSHFLLCCDPACQAEQTIISIAAEEAALRQSGGEAQTARPGRGLAAPSPVLTLTRAELRNFWGGAAAGVTLLVFLGLLGFFFYNSVVSYVVESLNATARGQALDPSPALFSQGLANIPLVLMLVTPLVTMRSLSPYRRGGGLDYFQTLPVGGRSLVAGQYLAAVFSLGFLSLLGVAPFTFLLGAGVGRPELLLTALAGLWALSSAFAAIGILASAVFPSPVGAGLATLGLLGLMWVLGWATPYTDSTLGLVDLWRGLAFAPRMTRLALGLVSLGDLFFFLAVTLLALINARLFLKARALSGVD